MESQWVVNGKEPRASRICSWYILFSLNLKLGEPHKMDPQMTLKTILATHWPSELLDEFTPLRAFHDFAVKSQDDKTGRINSQGSHHVRKQLGPVGSQSWWRLKEQSFLHMLPWGPSAVFLLLALLKWSDFSEVQQHLAMSGNSYLFIAPIGSQVGNLDNYPMILLACWAYLGIVHFTAPSNPSSGLLDLFSFSACVLKGERKATATAAVGRFVYMVWGFQYNAKTLRISTGFNTVKHLASSLQNFP